MISTFLLKEILGKNMKSTLANFKIQKEREKEKKKAREKSLSKASSKLSCKIFC